MTDRRYPSGWWIVPFWAVGVVGLLALATCAHAATGGSDSPLVTVCVDSLPPLSENGVGPRGAPAASSSDFGAIPGVYAGFTDTFFANLTPGYVTGGKFRPEVVTPPGSDLPAVPVPATAALILSALAAVAILARRKK
ncbi:PEP-CTERM sorting domain-containing protein [Sinirhodobacter populi]|uniref:PEP-CTERM sorting domain-containing protein n=1 Tax=Paenirhodobacter populi TaxID=2306993 RepID=A0A443K7W2_9RHOB|nr:PEP-CTERM sorting domain-containing protein [Sinirhodobacter populi]RWR28812.1 PEP-CTERM sorting domain-containing protein [Sinirhodobacter populi]